MTYRRFLIGCNMDDIPQVCRELQEYDLENKKLPRIVFAIYDSKVALPVHSVVYQLLSNFRESTYLYPKLLELMFVVPHEAMEDDPHHNDAFHHVMHIYRRVHDMEDQFEIVIEKCSNMETRTWQSEYQKFYPTLSEALSILNNTMEQKTYNAVQEGKAAQS